MADLTLSIIRKVIAGDARIDQNIDLDEPGKAIVCLNPGWMFYDGTATWGFNLKGCKYDEPDTLAYLAERISLIEPNPDEA